MSINLDINVNKILRWLYKGGFGVLDQAFYSGANFIVSVLLARWITKLEYGEYAVGFAVVFFFLQVYTSFAIEPMSVLGPVIYKNSLISYLESHILLMFLIFTPLVLLLSGGVVLWEYFQSHSLYFSILAASVAGIPIIVFLNLMRRIFYVVAKPSYAFVGSFFYFVVVVVGISVLKYFEKINGLISVGVMILACLVSGLLMKFLLNGRLFLTVNKNLLLTLKETSGVGKWLIISGVLIGLATQSQVYLLGASSQLEEAAAVRILQTIIQPMMLISTALSALVTPLIAIDFELNNLGSMRRKILYFMATMGGIAFVYEVLLIYFENDIIKVFGTNYLSYAYQVKYWGMMPLILSFFLGGFIALQAARKLLAMVIIGFFWFAFSIIPAIFIIPSLGSWGATISSLIGFIAAGISTWVLYWLWIERESYQTTEVT